MVLQGFDRFSHIDGTSIDNLTYSAVKNKMHALSVGLSNTNDSLYKICAVHFWSAHYKMFDQLLQHSPHFKAYYLSYGVPSGSKWLSFRYMCIIFSHMSIIFTHNLISVVHYFQSYGHYFLWHQYNFLWHADYFLVELLPRPSYMWNNIALVNQSNIVALRTAFL